MHRIFPLTFFILFGLGSLTAQTFIGKINPFPSSNPAEVTAGDTLKILAVMVSFQNDRDGTTFGNGKFGSIYSQDYGNTILDPLPHDKSYFEAHLKFIKNYFEKVSNGQLFIQYTVLPDTFSVSQTMRIYSPPNNSDDFSSLVDFSQEVWQKADAMNPGFDFSNYDIFTIFHAGVGRDISLPGSIGNENDLPSVYLSLNALQNVLGPDFTGFPVSGGSFNIKNSMIIPETESREIESIGGSVLFQVSINGLLAASVGSYLGLPDLFNTETGLSAIGRFGLMDGQSIFAYNGIYPPQPSAWEKIFLGWAQPVEIDPGNYSVNLTADQAAGLSDTTILKVPINSTEYYLVENRERDVNNDGSIITYQVNGTTFTRTFTKDTTGYYSYDVDSVDGVVTDVDEFDWAVPGNGIVIWHIDQNVIDAKIASNKINTDKYNRGVDVEEADGIQDIGEQFTTVFGDVVIGEGGPEDFWYRDNPSELYENKFSKDTRPPAITNSGANSLITMAGFSNISNTMSFSISYGDSTIVPIFSRNTGYEGSKFYLTAIQNYFTFGLETDSSLYLLNSSGAEAMPYIGGLSSSKIAAFTNSNVQHIAGTKGRHLAEYITDGTTPLLTFLTRNDVITTPPVIRYLPDTHQPQILIGTSDGKIVMYKPAELPSTAMQIQDSLEYGAGLTVQQIAADSSFIAAIFSSVNRTEPYKGYQDNEGNSVNFRDETPVKLEITKDGSGNYIAVILTSSKNFFVISGSKILTQWNVSGSAEINSFAIADLKQDGENYIIYNNGETIEVRNLTGSLADNFPFKDPDSREFSGNILAADFEGNDNSEIIASTVDGRIFAIDGGTGKTVYGFPISTGAELSAYPILYKDNGKISLAVFNSDMNLSAWNIGLTEGNIFWGGEYGDPENSSFAKAASRQNFTAGFFPADKAYNYPNPVYDNQTYIRYYVSEDAKINIKIFDLAGDYVAELNDDAQGGLDNETVWNVGDIQSGVYLARIEVTGVSGKTDSKIIKIAVVK